MVAETGRIFQHRDLIHINWRKGQIHAKTQYSNFNTNY